MSKTTVSEREWTRRTGEEIARTEAAAEAANRGARKATKPKLSESALYFGDNGRVFCGKLHCAGMTAHFTGRDLSGQRVTMARDVDKTEWIATVGSALACETCGYDAEGRL